jgi:cystathionine gamma-synthase
LGVDSTKQCILLPTNAIAERCRKFILQQRDLTSNCKETTNDIYTAKCIFGSHSVYVTVVSKEDWVYAKAFWQHTGDGISSRFAERCLHEAGISWVVQSATSKTSSSDSIEEDESEIWEEANTYIEERYGRNLCSKQANEAKLLMKQRIVEELIKHDIKKNNTPMINGTTTSPTESALTQDDVYLYPCGMSAIYNTHRLLQGIHPERKSVCYG